MGVESDGLDIRLLKNPCEEQGVSLNTDVNHRRLFSIARATTDDLLLVSPVLHDFFVK